MPVRGCGPVSVRVVGSACEGVVGSVSEGCRQYEGCGQCQ